MSEWQLITETKRNAILYRSGFLGVYDSIISWLTKNPRKTTKQDVTIGVYVKSDNDVRVNIINPPTDKGEDNE